ncbi:MAG: DUF2891 domain-containing protein, partial [Firmicutes bacterium]|nr:DUF2891 domain-containing protein [Bacillota bacterium]
AFQPWLKGFLPELMAAGNLDPAKVSDRTDPRIVHLDGLNLSRARNLYVILEALKASPAQRSLLVTADRHAEASLPFIASGSYEGEHWLGTFAVHMLDARNRLMGSVAQK